MGNKRMTIRLSFAYTVAEANPLMTVGAALCAANSAIETARRSAGFAAEMSYSPVPSIVYAENEVGQHGNFLPASYQRILHQPGLEIAAGQGLHRLAIFPRKTDRTRRELECANSSDALLMNIFCYPGVLRRSALCSLLGIEPGIHPAFGFRPRNSIAEWCEDRSEIDLKLGKLFVEAKLTEGDFQTAGTAWCIAIAIWKQSST